MTDDTTALIIKELINSCDTDLAVEDVTLDMLLREDLEMDSLAAACFFMNIEDKLAVLAIEDEVGNLQTVGDAVEAIKQKLSAQES